MDHGGKVPLVEARTSATPGVLGDMHRGINLGIRKSVLALLQVNNIKIALTPEDRVFGTGLRSRA
jgi:hypothetical protein